MKSTKSWAGMTALAFAGLIAVGSGGRGRRPGRGVDHGGRNREELKVVALGWSAKKKILGKAVYNDKNEKIGVVDDLIITPDKSVFYAIVGAGGFLGMGKHDVAIPVGQFKEDKGRIVRPGHQRRPQGDAEVRIREVAVGKAGRGAGGRPPAPLPGRRGAQKKPSGARNSQGRTTARGHRPEETMSETLPRRRGAVSCSHSAG